MRILVTQAYHQKYNPEDVLVCSVTNVKLTETMFA